MRGWQDEVLEIPEEQVPEHLREPGGATYLQPTGSVWSGDGRCLFRGCGGTLPMNYRAKCDKCGREWDRFRLSRALVEALAKREWGLSAPPGRG